MTSQVAFAYGTSLGLVIGVIIGYAWRRPRITRKTTTVVCPIRLDGREIARTILKTTGDDDGPVRF